MKPIALLLVLSLTAGHAWAQTDMSSNLTPDAWEKLRKLQAEGQDPHAGIDMSAYQNGSGQNIAGGFSWVLPQAWAQGPDKPMRLASFYVRNDPGSIDGYIVALPGTGGGLEDNLKRWMEQAGIVPSGPNLHKLVAGAQKVQTKDGFQAVYYDFTAFPSVPNRSSMIAAVIPQGNWTLFVKMVGPVRDLKANLDRYRGLLESISFNQ